MVQVEAEVRATQVATIWWTSNMRQHLPDESGRTQERHRIRLATTDTSTRTTHPPSEPTTRIRVRRRQRGCRRETRGRAARPWREPRSAATSGEGERGLPAARCETSLRRPLRFAVGRKPSDPRAPRSCGHDRRRVSGRRRNDGGPTREPGRALVSTPGLPGAGPVSRGSSVSRSRRRRGRRS